MTMFHLVASILAISDSITDLVLLDTPSVLAHELVKPAVDVAALLVLALRTVNGIVDKRNLPKKFKPPENNRRVCRIFAPQGCTVRRGT